MQPATVPTVWPEGVPPPLPPNRLAAFGRTKSGILLLLLATLLLWIPTIEILGLIIGAVAVILILLGASAFDPWHGRLVGASVAVFVSGFIFEFAMASSFLGTIETIPGNATGPAAIATALNAFDGLVTGSLIAVALLSVSSALILFDLADLAGRLLLVAGVVAQILISIFVFVIVLNPIIHQAVSQAFASTPMNPAPIIAADEQLRSLGSLVFLNAIPALFFVGAYAWVYDRVSRGATGPTGRKLGSVSPALRVGVLVMLVLVSIAATGAVASGALTLTPSRTKTWQPLTMFTGNGTGTTANFTISAIDNWFDINITDNGPGGYSFYVMVYMAGTGADAGACGAAASGPGFYSSSCSGPSAFGTYYLDITEATNVSSWSITVMQLI